MNLFSLIIAGLFGLLLLAFSVLLCVAIVFNLNAGKRYREGLAQQLDALRLSNMLTALGVDINDYLHTERAVDIHAQMDRCSGCGQTRECDERLATGQINSREIDFCENEQTLAEVVRRHKSAQ